MTAHFDAWAERVDFVFGMDANAALRGRAEALDESRWTRLERPANTSRRPSSGGGGNRTKAAIVTERDYLDIRLNHEDVAEFDYQPGKCARPYRMIALRKNITKSRGEQVLLGMRSATSSTSPPAPT